MNTPADPLATLLRDWAGQEIRAQVTPLTPDILRCKARLAQLDARRLRLRRLQALLLVPPGLLLLFLMAQAGTVVGRLQSLSPQALGSLLALALLAVVAAPALSLDGER
jgi:hypothetical protein